MNRDIAVLALSSMLTKKADTRPAPNPSFEPYRPPTWKERLGLQSARREYEAGKGAERAQTDPDYAGLLVSQDPSKNKLPPTNSAPDTSLKPYQSTAARARQDAAKAKAHAAAEARVKAQVPAPAPAAAPAAAPRTGKMKYGEPVNPELVKRVADLQRQGAAAVGPKMQYGDPVNPELVTRAAELEKARAAAAANKKPVSTISDLASDAWGRVKDRASNLSHTEKLLLGGAGGLGLLGLAGYAGNRRKQKEEQAGKATEVPASSVTSVPSIESMFPGMSGFYSPGAGALPSPYRQPGYDALNSMLPRSRQNTLQLTFG